jgi:flagellar operon protein
VAERDVDLSNDSISRLDEGVRIAQSKGLNDTLIIVDKTAFIVNVKNNTVVTTVSGDNLRGNVFTNIDGTVII